jgi:microcystin-dependent protein
MTQPFIGEIRMFGSNFAPQGWMFCSGQTISISQNTALFSLIGTFYGGNGTTTFQLPNLQGRLPVHYGQGPGLSVYSIGQSGGVETVALNTTQMPQHSHSLNASTATATLSSPTNNVTGAAPLTPIPTVLYTNPGTPATVGNLLPQAVGANGSGLPHSNIMPYLCVSFIIATVGIFPSRN